MVEAVEGESARNTRVAVTGLKDLVKALKVLNQQAPDELKRVLKAMAQDVVDDAQARVPTVTGRAKRSYRPRGTTRGASVAFGGPKAPHAPWLDWGGSTKVDGPNTGGQNKGRVYRPISEEGRYLYPAIYANLEDLQERTAAVLNVLCARYGIEVE